MAFIMRCRSVNAERYSSAAVGENFLTIEFSFQILQVEKLHLYII